MRRLPLTVLAAAALSIGGLAQAATVELRNSVARVTVIPETRSDIKVEIVRANPSLPLIVRTQGDRTLVDGKLDRRIRSCRGEGDRSSVDVRRVGAIGWSEMPQVVIRTPRDAKIEASGAVFGAVGRSGSFSLINAGCGDWAVANVEGEARVSQAGSGDTRFGSVGSLRMRVAGSGDVAATVVQSGLDIRIAGSGSGNVGSASGPMDIGVAGSGGVSINGGRATQMKISVAGSGDVRFAGSADTLKARITGSGDIRVGTVKGEVSKAIMGSGSIRIGN